MAKGEIGRIAYVLALVGGILLVIFSLLELVGMAISIPFGMPGIGIFAGFGAIIGIILGIIAIFGSKRVMDLVWAIVLIVVGFLGGGIGGLLVIIGGILGLVARFI
jgi:hypothetical protein